jgi:radical SAM superfamily enzyme YgiQ (UPF0313 family)
MLRLLRDWQRYVDADDPGGTLFLSRQRLAELPMPARHLVDIPSYRYTIDGVAATSLIAQLGCPFQCTFCAGRASPMLRRARLRPVDGVLAELRHLHERYGFSGFMFYDDELNVNNKSALDLFRGVRDLGKELKTEFRLRGFVKAELLTQEQADVMYEAGFRWLLSGFESGSPRILENINKRATVDDNARCTEIARRAGLKVKALMSIGHAGETDTTVQETRDWLLAMKPDDFDCTVITPYPGSPYYDEAVETEPRIWTYTSPRTGDRLHADEVDYTTTADYYKGDPDGGYRAYVFTDGLSREELVTWRNTLERTVRASLGIPFNPSRAAQRYEHSMGQSALPTHILRSTVLASA